MKKQMMAEDRLMPFDFMTHRKVKQFFKEDIQDIDFMLQHKVKQTDVDEQIREVPELTKELKELLKIVMPHKKKNKKKKLIIKGASSSSSSNDERFHKYNYASKVQNTQNRGYFNDCMGIYFQRSQAKNSRIKSNIYIVGENDIYRETDG